MVKEIFFLIVMFTIYNYLIFSLIDTLLENPRLPKKLRIPVGILNTVIAFLLTVLGGSTSLAAYIIVAVILLTEFIIFYKDEPVRSLFCMLACVVHIMTMRSVCVALFAVFTRRTFYGVVDSPVLLVLSTGVTFAVLNIVVLGVIKIIPSRKIKIINQHSELLWFMVSWLSIFSVYLLFNARVYALPDYHPALIANQIVAPLTILCGLYIVLFFTFKASELLGYKEKSEKLEHVVEKERQYRTVIGKDILVTFEVNFTKNKIITGFEEYEEILGEDVHDYAIVFSHSIQENVHPEDRDKFFPYSSPIFVINAFEQGQKELTMDYRRLMQGGEYKWVRIFVALIRDSDNGDIKGFAQIKDIDSEKKSQLELLEKAERDQLTGLYNKATTEYLITEILKQCRLQDDKHALMMIDIDFFKEVNDKLGHLYGDIVLAQLAEGLRPLFRSDDVVGRIGGDEFFVFLKNYNSDTIVKEKAEEICRLFNKTYRENEIAVKISASVGIALCPEHGTNFEELYRKADIALYTNKERGKNGFVIYDGQAAASYQSARTEIDVQGYFQKSFKENRLEYVFKLMYEAENPVFAINSVLKLVAENFCFANAYIYEKQEENIISNTFACCAHIGKTDVLKTEEMPVSSIPTIMNGIENDGKLIVKGIEEIPEDERALLGCEGVKSMLFLGIRNGKKYAGFIRLDDREKNRTFTDKEWDEISTIGHLLSVFLVKHRTHESERQHYEAVEAIMANLESLTYVIDRDSYLVLYENSRVNRVTQSSFVGEKCYEVYRGNTSPCDDCPMRGLSDTTDRCTKVIHINKFGITARATASWIKWTNGKKSCLITSMDMAEYELCDTKQNI